MIFVHELFFSSVDGRRRERERVAYLARTPSASPRRSVGIGDEARVLFTRAAASRRASPSSLPGGTTPLLQAGQNGVRASPPTSLARATARAATRPSLFLPLLNEKKPCLVRPETPPPSSYPSPSSLPSRRARKPVLALAVCVFQCQRLRRATRHTCEQLKSPP